MLNVQLTYVSFDLFTNVSCVRSLHLNDVLLKHWLHSFYGQRPFGFLAFPWIDLQTHRPRPLNLHEDLDVSQKPYLRYSQF